MPDDYIGLISGTSMDGIDAVLATITDDTFELRETHVHAYPEELRVALQSLIARPEACDLDELGSLDRWIGECFRDAALALVEKSDVSAADIVAIGSHGQTLRHQPAALRPFSLQVGDPATIAAGTGIATVADFRRADIAAGGQGAPLVPPFHEWLFRRPGRHRVVLNLGGIANVTVLPGNDAPVTGFDTGPGNTLLDAWIGARRSLRYDEDGQWAAAGTVVDDLLHGLIGDEYFKASPPKSTGFERFNLQWLSAFSADKHDPRDVQATLSELTAISVAAAIDQYAPATSETYVCGGGVHNRDLMQRLRRRLSKGTVESTLAVGLDPDWVEAAAFAWLAMRTLGKKTGNLPSVTGASHKVVLGAIHYP